MVFDRFKKALKSEDNSNDNSFSRLDKILDTGTDILLENDFEMTDSRFKGEKEKFSLGILLNTDGQVIDGGGHTIDAKGLARIFNVRARNVTIKNIKIINGNLFNGYGGAINVEPQSSLRLINVEIASNTSKTEGGAVSNFGELTVEDSLFTGNVSQKDGGAVYNHGESVLNIKNTRFINNRASVYGGAICNQLNARLTVTDSVFEDNIADNDGGAILNFGIQNIEDTIFKSNSSKLRGGAIFINSNTQSEISRTRFIENSAEKHAGALMSFDDTTISQCEFKHNTSRKEGGAINHQKNLLYITDSIFKNNSTDFNINDIVNFSDVKIINCEFEGDEYLIMNNAGAEITKSKFTQPISSAIRYPDDDALSLDECEFGERYILEKLENTDERNFTYLEMLIKCGKDEITLDSDIIMDDGESSKYENGIEITSDDLTIDGNGYSIDAGGSARIFMNKSRGLTLKNITLKNGYSKTDGAALYQNSGSSAEIINVRFQNNTADEDGGAIINFADIVIRGSVFEKNTVNARGGAIFSNSDTNSRIEDTKFISNSAGKNGGAVIGFGKAEFVNCEFTGNECKTEGGAINHQKDVLHLSNTLFSHNYSKDPGTAFINFDRAIITDCEFEGEGVLISNNEELSLTNSKFSLPKEEAIRYYDSLDLIDCEFKEKQVPKSLLKSDKRNFQFLHDLINCGAKEIILDSDIVIDDDEVEEFNAGIDIDNEIVLDGAGHTIDAGGRASVFKIYAKTTIKNLTFANGYSDSYGGAINAFEDLDLINTHFIKNHADDSGGAIQARNLLNVTDCVFEDNTADDYAGAIISYFDSDLNIENSKFTNNRSKNKGGAIHNIKRLSIKDSEFINNVSKTGGAINSISSEMEITDTKFKDNISDDRGCDVYQEVGSIKFKNVGFSSSKKLSVYSEEFYSGGKFYPVEFEDCSFDNTQLENILKELESGPKNFTYLDKLIKYSDGEIILNSDITLDDDELSKYEEGIVIDTEWAKLNGNGHKINARGKVRIFDVKRSFELKNITLEAGYHATRAGAINNNTNLILENVTFKNNVSKNWGGAISNSNILNTETRLTSCSFYENEGVSGSCIFISSGPMEITDCEFVKNTGYDGVIDTLYEDTKLTVRDSTFSNNTLENSGVIYNSSNTNVSNCVFADNFSEHGGAIENIYELHVSDCEFKNNGCKEGGGAVYNRREGSAKFTGCTFYKNHAEMGSAIFNEEGQVRLVGCIVENHETEVPAIHTVDYLEMIDCEIKNNRGDCVVLNDENGDLSVNSGVFSGNVTLSGVIQNRGRNSVITKSSFENNTSQNPNCQNILNQSDMLLNGIKINDEGLSILNEVKLSLKNLDRDFVNFIHGDGEVIFIGGDFRDGYNFTYLDGLIKNAESSEVKLTTDISMNDAESEFYEGGIELEREGLTIDGDGHTIDAGGNSRIFLVLAKKITLKNINFKNGFVFRNYDNELNGGGAIHNNSHGEIIIENCSFADCVSENDGGVINNFGKLTLNASRFTKNRSKNHGGAVYSYANAKTQIRECEFKDNSSQEGAAVYTQSPLIADSAIFDANAAEGDGGAIYTWKGDVDLSNIIFKDNSSFSGSAVMCRQECRVRIHESRFINNTSDLRGGAISIYYTDSVTIAGCEFVKNKSKDGGVIYNDSCRDVSISSSSFKGNESSEGGVLDNSTGSVKITSSTFNKNRSDEGGIIHNLYGLVDIDNGEIKKNSAKKGGAIYNGDNLRLRNVTLEANSADEGGAIFNLRERISKTPFAPPRAFGNLKLNNVTFRGNVSKNSGGAIYCEKTGKISGDNVTFEANRADKGNDIWAEDEGDVNIASVKKKSRLKGLFGR